MKLKSITITNLLHSLSSFSPPSHFVSADGGWFLYNPTCTIRITEEDKELGYLSKEHKGSE